ncbi:MAG: TDP-N-acetylfucosamine:lipid II N-acetylfucosaminyltransferase [Clostridia bacterium]|nr:TDP-N-acetylfucosamine:lipid II N-acetylfucosaminyltransferase [Clostridia bacterium]MCI9127730.1 TDP-N-acetylfucosamine:lipid II N-acetylfucosaminyltransferase [Eubacterium sp.]NBJ01478.1 hypothetical protein [Lachnospiraceae bacterium]
MNILHVFSFGNQQYTDAMIKFQSKYFNDINHKFIFTGNKESASDYIKSREDINYIPLNRTLYKNIKKISKKYDFIIMHSLIQEHIFALKTLFSAALRSKLIWIVWGKDLYSWKKLYTKNIFVNIQRLIFNSLGKYYRSHLKLVVSDECDKEYYSSEFGVYQKQMFFSALNPLGYDTELIDSLKPNVFDENLRIMIGHSTAPELNHIETINNLKKINLPTNTKYIFPLCYGYKEIGDEVSEYAIQVFGKNAEIYRDKMSIENYIKLLWSVDCAIFHTNRQIGLGNIYMLMYMGKKVFFPKNSVLDIYFKKRGITTFNSNNLDTHLFSKKNVYTERESMFINDIISIDSYYKNWTNIYMFLNTKK